MLKLRPVDEPRKLTKMIAVLISPPGVGKTTLALTGGEKPLIVAYDEGVYRAVIKDAAEVQATTWADLNSITHQDILDNGFDTIIIDTVGSAINALERAGADASASNRKRDGSTSLQGYGYMKTQFSKKFDEMLSWGINLILVFHGKVANDPENPGRIYMTVDAVGSAKEEILRMADVIGCITETPDGGRTLSLDPSQFNNGKNPAQLPPLSIPQVSEDPENPGEYKNGTWFLDNVIKPTKDHIEADSARQKERKDRHVKVKKQCEKAAKEGVASLNKLMAKMVEKDANRSEKGILNAVAKASGFRFDKEAKEYFDPEAETEVTDEGEPVEAEVQPDPAPAPDADEVPLPEPDEQDDMPF